MTYGGLYTHVCRMGHALRSLHVGREQRVLLVLNDTPVVGGEWVSPIEVEHALIEHAAVQEAAVVGMSIDGTTRIRAVVVLAPGDSESDELTRDLQRWCKERLQRYKFPHRVDYVSSLPKTATGKVQRYRLREV